MLAVYQHVFGPNYSLGPLKLKEHHVYGSSRLGLVRRDVDVTNILNPKKTPVAEDLIGNTYVYTAERGRKLYELTNHLGNVLVTVTDKKIGVPSSGNSSLIDHYTADVVTASDYYPFGMLMPGRTFSSSSYRYSINGQEKEKEINANITSAEYWMYDSRIGRRWNTDPVVKDDESPYMTFGDNPVVLVDPNGLDWYHNSKTHETQWFNNRREARKAGFTKYVNNRWMKGEKPNTWIWHGSTEGDVVQYSGVLEPVVVTAKAKKQSLMNQSPTWQAFNRSLKEGPQWDAGYTQYFTRKRDGLAVSQPGDDEYYKSHMESYERH